MLVKWWALFRAVLVCKNNGTLCVYAGFKEVSYVAELHFFKCYAD